MGRIHVSDNIYVSMTLLMVVAIAKSQSEYKRPVFWESYSAGRAKAELLQEWRDDNDNTSEFVSDIIKIVSALIRFQSDPGQYARGTGDLLFISKAKQITDKINKNNKIKIEKNIIINALKVMAVIQEARNHRIPYKVKNRKIERGEKSADEPYYDPNFKLKRNWDRGKINEIIDKLSKKELEKPDHGRWGFTSNLNKNECMKKELSEFKSFVEDNYRELLTDTFDKPKKSDIAQYSFGRSQSNDLAKELCEAINEIVKEFDTRSKINKFNDYFHTNLVKIPDPFEERQEMVIEILLNDLTAAEKLIFNYGELTKISKNGNAADLLLHLYSKAKDLYKLNNVSHGISGQYMPYALFDRLLKISYRLRPERSISLEIQFDNEPPTNIYLPIDLNKNDEEHLELIHLIASFIPTFVLNTGMSRGFKTCDITFGSFDKTNAPATPKNVTMDGDQWKRIIDKAFNCNGCELLTEKYLSDYNKERKNVRRLKISKYSTLLPLPIDELNEKLKGYLEAKEKSMEDEEEEDIFFLALILGEQI